MGPAAAAPAPDSRAARQAHAVAPAPDAATPGPPTAASLAPLAVPPAVAVVVTPTAALLVVVKLAATEMMESPAVAVADDAGLKLPYDTEHLPSLSVADVMVSFPSSIQTSS